MSVKLENDGYNYRFIMSAFGWRYDVLQCLMHAQLAIVCMNTNQQHSLRQ